MNAALANQSLDGVTDLTQILAVLRENVVGIREMRCRQDEDRKRQDETWAELWALHKKTEKKIKALTADVKGTSDSFGKFMEKMIAANIEFKFNEFGYFFTRSHPETFLNNDGTTLAQADILLENGEYMMLVEVKLKLTHDDVDEHVERMEKVRGYFDRHGYTRKLVGAVAGGIVSESVRRYAEKRGFYVLFQNGKSIDIAEKPGEFTAAVW